MKLLSAILCLTMFWYSYSQDTKQHSGTYKKPNIIFILADDLGYGDVGCYGQKQIKTPVLDRMAKEGMRFTNNYAGSTVCAPSRYCLMTGLHTGHTDNSQINSRLLLDSDITVAEILKKAGYATAVVGKWALGDENTSGLPNKQGFDYSYGFLNQTLAHNYYPEVLWRNGKEVKLKNEVVPAKSGPGGVASKRVEYADDLFTQEGLNFIEKNKKNPFFLYLAYTIPHANNEAGEKGMEVPSDKPYTNKSWPEAQRNHAAMITRMDGDIGRLFARLKDLGIDQNTLVIFSSDNGPHKEGGADPAFFDGNGPLRGIKRDLYEGGIRVPLIVRWPGKIKPASESNHLTAFWDFLPTCADLIGSSDKLRTDGISILPTLLGRADKQKKHSYLYWEYTTYKALRMDNWKAIKSGDGKMELYDLSKDLGETTNLADRHSDIVGKVKQYMEAAKK
ncbi:MAG: arylsulfatase [Segetibacter sp.]|nr:arylsulfatase [Segetibacter sp.]